MANTALFEKVMTQVYRDPRTWNQRVWGERVAEACNTSHCIAGHASVLSGATPLWERRYKLDSEGSDTFVVAAVEMNRVIDPATGDVLATSVYGARVLGLTTEQAHTLFNAQEHEKVWGLVSAYTRGKVTKESIAALVAKQDAMSETPAPADPEDDPQEDPGFTQATVTVTDLARVVA